MQVNIDFHCTLRITDRLFSTIDEDSDGRLSAKELRALIVGIQFEEIDMNINDAVAQVLKDMDKSEDSFIDVHEFVAGISRWLIKAKHSAKWRDGTPMTPKILNDFDQVCCLFIDI